MVELTGYAKTMDCLADPKGWDVPGMIADVAENIRRGLDVPPGQVLAVIDTLVFRMKDIANLIHPGHATRIDPKTLGEAAYIVETIVGRGRDQGLTARLHNNGTEVRVDMGNTGKDWPDVSQQGFPWLSFAGGTWQAAEDYARSKGATTIIRTGLRTA